MTTPLLSLTWTDHVSDECGYKVEASRDNVLFYEIADLPADTMRFVNTGVEPRPYFYRVRAFNRGGYSEYSNNAQISPKKLTP